MAGTLIATRCPLPIGLAPVAGPLVTTKPPFGVVVADMRAEPDPMISGATRRGGPIPEVVVVEYYAFASFPNRTTSLEWGRPRQVEQDGRGA